MIQPKYNKQNNTILGFDSIEINLVLIAIATAMDKLEFTYNLQICLVYEHVS